MLPDMLVTAERILRKPVGSAASSIPLWSKKTAMITRTISPLGIDHLAFEFAA
jgi:hypothetical protein